MALKRLGFRVKGFRVLAGVYGFKVAPKVLNLGCAAPGTICFDLGGCFGILMKANVKDPTSKPVSPPGL